MVKRETCSCFNLILVPVIVLKVKVCKVIEYCQKWNPAPACFAPSQSDFGDHETFKSEIADSEK